MPATFAGEARPSQLPLVVAHRGASGYRPEHTLEAYRLAIALGADFVEPDLVLTADNVPVARHENELSATTDIAERPEFADRRTTKAVDGLARTGWFVEDLTLTEIKKLRARERLPDLRQHNQLYDDRFTVPTFAEVVELVRAESARLGRPVGVYPETKLPTYFARLGLFYEDALLKTVSRFGPTVPVYIQSFEPWSLRRLAKRTSLPLVQLIDASGRPDDFERAGDARTYSDLLTPSGLREVSTYAEVLGVHKSLLIPRSPDGRLGRPSGLADRARSAGLAVHGWTFRNENAFLPAECRRGSSSGAYGDAFSEYAAFAGQLDGIVTDHPDTAVAARAVPLPADLLQPADGSRPR